MWKWVHDSKPPLYLLFKEDHSGYQIFGTDYISLWCENFTKESFYSRLKECNKNLEFESNEDFIRQGIAMLTQPDKMNKLQMKKEIGDKILSICMSMSFGYSFKFECKLAKLSEQFFFQYVTKHLLETIMELRSSETSLRETIKKKDVVIKACIDKGVSLTTRRLKVDAVKFNDEDHMNGHNKFETVFGPNLDSVILLTKTELSSDSQTATTNGTIKMEPESIKIEPETPNDDDLPITNSVSINVKHEGVKTEPLSSNIVVKKLKRRLNI